MSNLAVQTTTPRPHYGLGNEHPITEKKSENTTWFSDWLNNDDKVCTDGFDDGSLSLEETAESFGKGLIGIVKTAVNHPIATGLTLAAGIGLTVLTGGAAAPILVAAGATIGTGMVGYGAYKAATAETDAEAKQAWETIGNGTFAVATSALGAKSALNQASKAGVTSAQGAKDLNIGKALIQNFKSIPESLKVSKGNVITNLTGALAPNAGFTTQDMKGYIDSKGNALKQKIVPEGTKYIDSKGVVTVETESVLISDKSGNLHHIPYKDLLSQYGITESHIKGLPQQKVVDIIFKNANIENALKIHANSTHMDAPISGGCLFAREMHGGTSACIKAEILREKGVELMYGYNNYNGGDPLLGYKVNGKLYELPDLHCNTFDKHAKATDYIITQLETQTFPATTTKDAIIAKHPAIDFLYSK